LLRLSFSASSAWIMPRSLAIVLTRCSRSRSSCAIFSRSALSFSPIGARSVCPSRTGLVSHSQSLRCSLTSPGSSCGWKVRTLLPSDDSAVTVNVGSPGLRTSWSCQTVVYSAATPLRTHNSSAARNMSQRSGFSTRRLRVTTSLYSVLISVRASSSFMIRFPFWLILQSGFLPGLKAGEESGGLGEPGGRLPTRLNGGLTLREGDTRLLHPHRDVLWERVAVLGCLPQVAYQGPESCDQLVSGELVWNLAILDGDTGKPQILVLVRDIPHL